MKLESFNTILSDCTPKYNKIKKEDYLPEGKFPIIDQGQKFVGGFTDDGDLITDIEKELIIFGDHTKILKFIDFPIAIGADGVKVLHVNKEKADPRYIYYFLKSVKLTDAGYSRHFKFLKEIKIPVPENINDQVKIARLLNHVETLIIQRKESISLLDELLKSAFLDMFGNPVKNEKGWNLKTIEQLVTKNKTSIKRGPFGGALKKEIFVEDGYLVYEQFHALNNDFSMARYFIDETKFHELKGFEVKPKDIIISCSGVYLGKLAIVPPNAKKGIINQALLKLTLEEKIMRNQFFVFHFTHKNFKEKYFDSNRGAGIPNFPPMSDFKKFNFITPPIELQDKFIEIVERVEDLKKEYDASLKELENMYGVLSQKAFKGELNIKKSLDDYSVYKVIEKKDINELEEFYSKFTTEEKKDLQFDFKNELFFKVIDDADKIIGIGSVLDDFYSYDNLKRFIDPAFRGKKIAEKLLDEIIEYAKSNKKTRIKGVFKTDEKKAKFFFESKGFKIIDGGIKIGDQQFSSVTLNLK